MGDLALSSTQLAEPQPPTLPQQHQQQHPPPPHPHPPQPQRLIVPPPLNDVQDTADSPIANGEDEPYTIRCICDYADDDGNTVLCENCNTWQHISCYYYPKERLEEDFHHICADCQPRREGVLDKVAARQRQRRLREPVGSEDRKKRAPTKHRKSKTKDLTIAQANGWLLNDSNRDGSPRDGAPPTKKPKTSHKASRSLSNTLNFRNRSGSHVQPIHHTPPPLSICPNDWFSPEFIRLHRENTTWEHTDTNINVDIPFSSRVGDWLDNEEQFAADTNGRTHQDVFKRLAVPIEEILMPRWEVRTKEEHNARFHGEHPIWKYVTVEQDLPSGQIFGELTGSIGPRDEYQKDPANHWEHLRHPEHFVFFHPILPLYIDCRAEGTALRYVRRSCRPNLKIETLVTGERDLRFVLTAVDFISAGSEVTIGWDTTGLQQYGSLDEMAKSGGLQSMDSSTTEYLSDWAQTLLAHFGGCPCDKHTGQICLMDHFDRRISKLVGERPVKNGRKRKASRKDSPLPDHLQSRASSEAIARDDEDEEMDDNRSTSHSTQSETSRDGTPNVNGKGFGNELSEREKKKLLQQEKLFEQMEQDSHGTKRKKRPSGSNANTPTVENPKSGFFFSEAKQKSRSESRRMTNGNTPPRNRSTATPKPRPVYVDASTQTEEEAKPVESCPRPPRVSLVRKILKRSLLRSVQPPNGIVHEFKPAIKPPPPPWPAERRSPNLHVELPPPPNFKDPKDPDSAASATPVLPSPEASAMSPPDAVTKPTPIKKKISLSDYTKRQKAATPQTEKSPSQLEAAIKQEESVASEDAAAP